MTTTRCNNERHRTRGVSIAQATKRECFFAAVPRRIKEEDVRVQRTSSGNLKNLRLSHGFYQKLDRSTAGIALRIARRLEEDRRARKVYAS
ncbi:hypothetical protein HN011_005039, partial [Eciton burchellii]